MIIDVSEEYLVGTDSWFQSLSHENSFSVAFEDDETTGYFYAINTKPELIVLDGLHIYDVESVLHREDSLQLKIAWSADGMVASLLLNDYCHAIFDFGNQAGYCRNGFPPSRRDWVKVENRVLNDELIDSLFADRK